MNSTSNNKILFIRQSSTNAILEERDFRVKTNQTFRPLTKTSCSVRCKTLQSISKKRLS